MSFNKESRKRTGGGPFQELALSSAEELILEAAGIEVAVDGLSFVEPFPKKVSKTNVDEILEEIQVEDTSQSEYKEDVGSGEVTVKVNKKTTSSETKINLLERNLKKIEESKLDIGSKLDRLLELKERSLKIKIEQHSAEMKKLKIDLEIKAIELEKLKKISKSRIIVN